MLLQKMLDAKVIHPPKFVADNTCYLTLMGSEAYGVSTDTSDRDVYGFCIPPKDMVFPHLKGEIPGFGKQTSRYDQYQEHHVQYGNYEYDFAIFSIVRYFQLAMENNPNLLDSLFTPQRCVLHINQIGQMVRDNRKMFLHKGCFHKFRGYAYSQLHKIDLKNPAPGSKRHKDVEEHGFDLKFSYHVVRLLNQCEQILTEGDLDLERSREQLKAIRRGEWTIEQIKDYFNSKDKSLEELYNKSSLPYSPPEEQIKQLLMKCLEHHYGNLKDAVVIPGQVKLLISEIQAILDNYYV